MGYLISRKSLMQKLKEYVETVYECDFDDPQCTENGGSLNPKLVQGLWEAKEIIEDIPVAYDVDEELRLLKNYLDHMPKTYRKRNVNWVIVQDLLMTGTSRAGRTSSIKKCLELGIDAYDYNLIVKGCKQDG